MTKAKDIITVRKFYEHAINRGYMTGVTRDKSRVKATGEVFTPDGLVRDVIASVEKYEKGSVVGRKSGVLDPTCGDGQILAHVLLFKLVEGDFTKLDDNSFMNKNVFDEFKYHLGYIFGCDLMADNVIATRERLSAGLSKVSHILRRNIRCKDATTYDFSFDKRAKGDGEI